MPLYDYKCEGPRAHEFEVLLSFRDSNNPQLCKCGYHAKRVIKKPTAVVYKGSDWSTTENRGF